MALEIEIRKKLKEFELEVSFCAEDGCMAFMGPSGSGKSMTLKCIAGIERPDSGRIVLNGRVLYDSAQKICISPQKRNVGYLFQSYALFPNKNVEQNIQTGLLTKHLNRSQIREKTEEMIHKFHLEALEKRYPPQLSGGQRQRVALARLLAYDPEVVLLDEPFSALDEELKEELQQELRCTIRGLHRPTILVTHDSREAKLLSDKIIRIKKGMLMEA